MYHLLKVLMKKSYAAAAWLMLGVLPSLLPAWSADTSTDVQKVHRQASTIPDLLQSVANAAGYAVNSVGIRHTAQLVTVTVVNPKSHDSAVSSRESEAMAIASLVEAAMAGKVEYGHVALIRLEFVNRSGDGDDGVESFEFLRTETNTFALRKG